MSITTIYLCRVIGEDPARLPRLHHSTIKRMKAFAIAIHIPVTLWAMTGYVIASQIFGLDKTISALISLFCAGMIYMVERLVLATPKVWYVNLGRVFIGVIIAILGACAVDLVIFNKEVSQQLREAEKAHITAQYDLALSAQSQIADQKKQDWFKAQEAANCEANGTCGSKTRRIGPIYRALLRQAELLRQEHTSAQNRLDELYREKAAKLATDSSNAVTQAGLLARVEALHQYTMANTAALIAWMLFFSLVLFFELMVVLSKLVFGETVDDKIDMIREQVNHHKALAFMEAATSPVANARRLLEGVY